MLSLLLYAILTLVAGEEHEIVYPRMIVDRSGEKRLLFRAFDQDFHLRLEPTDVLAEGFVMITRDDKGNEAFLKPDVERWRQRVLQDRNTGSTVVVDEGPLQVKGVINEELRIEPVLDQVGSEEAQGRRDFGKGVQHRVIKINPRKNEGYYDEVVPPGVKPNTNTTDTTQADTRQSVAPTLEVFVVTDKKHSEALGSDKATLDYCCILFNCMNLRFSTMKNTPVTFKMVGLKRNLVSSDQPYIDNNMVDGLALAEETLTGFANYYQKNVEISKADLCHLLTKQSMGSKVEGSDKAEPGVLGIAYVGGVCDRMYKYGVSEDDAYRYSGCSTVAHELCHNLGGPHDGEPSPSYLPGSPGASSCPWNDGYMMSYVERYPNKYIFSKCSEQCVQYMDSISSCMRTQNVWNANIPNNNNRLPGQAVMDSTGLYDRVAYYNQRCKEVRSDLYVIQQRPAPGEGCRYRCRTPTDKDGYYYYWEIRCLDGDPCPEGKICKNGVCT